MEGGELLDWEIVHGSDTESIDSIASHEEDSSSVIDDGMMILSDHFSNHRREGVIELGDSSRVDDSGSDPQIPGFQLGLCDSGTVASGDVDFDVKEAVEEPIEDSSKSCSDSVGNEKVSEVGSEIVNGEEEEEIVAADSGVVVSSGTCSDSVVPVGDSEIVNGEEEEVVASTEANEESDVQVRDVNSEVRFGGGDDESKSRETVWWKMPFVLIKYCAFRIGPVWSVSMAAAVMGFVLLGRRLYHMKKKAERFSLKVTIDDKKVSRAMSQAARLNEVFTEVRRVPVIRPALPSPGAWPVLTLR